MDTGGVNCSSALKLPGRYDFTELKVTGGETSVEYPPKKFVGVELAAITRCASDSDLQNKSTTEPPS